MKPGSCALSAAGSGIEPHRAAGKGTQNVTGRPKRHQASPDSGTRACSQRIELATTAPSLGGTRRWFVCSVAGARRRILYLVEGR